MHRTDEELVSVIIPAYNAERWIGATLASAIAQTYRNLEVVVVDDGSTDKTCALVEEFAARDSRVRLLRQANGGVSAARNAAIAASSGSLIAPLDHDDLWYPEKIAKQVAAMQRGGQSVGLVYTWFVMIDEDGRIVAPREPRPWHEGNVYTAMLSGCFIESASIPLIRRSCLTEIGGYATDPLIGYCEDWKLNLDIAERYEFALVPEFLVGYRRHAEGGSNNISKMQMGNDTIIAETRQRHPELPERLFRDARSNCTLSSCLIGLRKGHKREALRLIAKIMVSDPLFPTRPAFRQRIARVLRKVGRRVGFVEKYFGRPFLEVPPR